MAQWTAINSMSGFEDIKLLNQRQKTCRFLPDAFELSTGPQMRLKSWGELTVGF